MIPIASDLCHGGEVRRVLPRCGPASQVSLNIHSIQRDPNTPTKQNHEETFRAQARSAQRCRAAETLQQHDARPEQGQDRTRHNTPVDQLGGSARPSLRSAQGSAAFCRTATAWAWASAASGAIQNARWESAGIQCSSAPSIWPWAQRASSGSTSRSASPCRIRVLQGVEQRREQIRLLLQVNAAAEGSAQNTPGATAQSHETPPAARGEPSTAPGRNHRAHHAPRARWAPHPDRRSPPHPSRFESAGRAGTDRPQR